MTNAIHAVVAPCKDGWTAYAVKSLEIGCKITTQSAGIEAGHKPTKEDAMSAFVEKVAAISDDPRHWTKSAQIRWFDHARHFYHCDTGFLYQDGFRTGVFVTFLAYEDGKAKVMTNNGEEMQVDSADISPCELHRLW